MEPVKRVWVCVGCPCNGVCHEVDESPCDACSGVTPEQQDFHVFLCPHKRCRFALMALNGPESAEYCPSHGNRLVSKGDLVAAALESAPGTPSDTPAAPVGNMMAFLATDRPMGNLSAAQRMMDAPSARVLWESEAFRKIVADEWKALKALMEEAGFE